MSGPQGPSPDGERGGKAGYGSFVEFVTHTCDALLVKAVLLCGDRALAEDAVADTYEEAYKRWEQITTPWAWVVTVLTHRIAKIASRDKRRRDKEVQGVLEVPMPPEALPEERAEIALVMHAVAMLPRRQRQVVILYYLCDRTQQEIAGLLGIRRGNVARTLSDALNGLRQVLRVAPPPVEPGDRLAPIPRSAPAGTSAALADSVAIRLLAAEAWLAGGSRADGRARGRINRMIAQRLPRGRPEQ